MQNVVHNTVHNWILNWQNFAFKISVPAMETPNTGICFSYNVLVFQLISEIREPFSGNQCYIGNTRLCIVIGISEAVSMYVQQGSHSILPYRTTRIKNLFIIINEYHQLNNCKITILCENQKCIWALNYQLQNKLGIQIIDVMAAFREREWKAIKPTRAVPERQLSSALLQDHKMARAKYAAHACLSASSRARILSV